MTRREFQVRPVPVIVAHCIGIYAVGTVLKVDTAGTFGARFSLGVLNKFETLVRLSDKKTVPKYLVPIIRRAITFANQIEPEAGKSGPPAAPRSEP